MVNWLLKFTDKGAYLYHKYLPMAKRVSDPAVPGRLTDFSTLFGQVTESALQRIIEKGIAFNKKYAEWYVYQLLTSAGISNMANLPNWTLSEIRNISDYLEYGHGRIPSLKTPPQDVIAAANQWHEEMKTKGGTLYKTNDVWAELSDGFKLVNVLKKDLGVEGHLMGHCVGGYCEQVEIGTIILSLRDAKNQPHATIELTQMKMSDLSDPNSTAFVDTGHYRVDQMKGKGDEPQPKYGKWINESLTAMMARIPITLSDEGATDFFGWNPEDMESQLAIFEQIQDQEKFKYHHVGTIFELHDLARHGAEAGDMTTWLGEEEGDAFKKRRVDYVGDKYFDWLLLKYTDVRTELINHFEDMRNLYVTGQDDGYSTEDYDEFIRDLEKGVVGYYGDSLVYALQEQARSFWHEDYSVTDYLIEEDSESVEEAYTESVLDKIDVNIDDPLELFQAWQKHYIRFANNKAREEHKARVERVIQEYGITFPPEADQAETLGRFHSGWLPEQETDEQWAARMEEMIDRNVKSNIDLKKTQDRLERKFQDFSAQLSTIVPGFSEITEYDQRALISHHLHRWDVLDEKAIEFANAFVKSLLEGQASAARFQEMHQQRMQQPQPPQAYASSNWEYKFAEEERIIAAAIYVRGTFYTGEHHGLAVDKAIEAGDLSFDDDGHIADYPSPDIHLDLFVTNKGRYLDRFNAYFEFNISASEHIEERSASSNWMIKFADPRKWLAVQGVPEEIIGYAVDDNKFPRKMQKWVAFQLRNLHKKEIKSGVVPMMHRTSTEAVESTIQLYDPDFIEIRDWYRSVSRSPQFNLYSHDFKSAQRGVEVWQLDMANVRGEGHVREYKHPDHNADDLGDGFHMVEVHPDDMKNEGAIMQNCVGDDDQEYVADVERGAMKIFSLRDSRGWPHATLEISAEEIDEEEGTYTSHWDQGDHHNLEWQISQIQGKQNKPPISKYRPYVKQWLTQHPEYNPTSGDMLSMSTDEELLIMIRTTRDLGDTYNYLSADSLKELAREIFADQGQTWPDGGLAWSIGIVGQEYRERAPQHVMKNFEIFLSNKYNEEIRAAATEEIAAAISDTGAINMHREWIKQTIDNEQSPRVVLALLDLMSMVTDGYDEYKSQHNSPVTLRYPADIVPLALASSDKFANHPDALNIHTNLARHLLGVVGPEQGAELAKRAIGSGKTSSYEIRATLGKLPTQHFWEVWRRLGGPIRERLIHSDYITGYNVGVREHNLSTLKKHKAAIDALSQYTQDMSNYGKEKEQRERDVQRGLTVQYGNDLVQPQHPEWTETWESKEASIKPTEKIASLPLTIIDENGRKFETGVPVEFRYLRNIEQAPNMGERFQQHLEPAGRYVIHNEEPGELPPGWEEGMAKFENPLVIEFNISGEHLYNDQSWKAILSQAYGGLSGTDLSSAIIKEGHDGIVTVMVKEGAAVWVNEIVDLRGFREASSCYQTKYAQLNGEWFIDDSGYAQFADSDIGDVNHEAAALQSMVPDELWEAFDNQTLTPEQIQEIGEEFVAYMWSGGEAREYMVTHQNWVRVHGSNFQLNILDVDAIQRIANFLAEELWDEEMAQAQEIVIHETKSDKLVEFTAREFMAAADSPDALARLMLKFNGRAFYGASDWEYRYGQQMEFGDWAQPEQPTQPPQPNEDATYLDDEIAEEYLDNNNLKGLLALLNANSITHYPIKFPTGKSIYILDMPNGMWVLEFNQGTIHYATDVDEWIRDAADRFYEEFYGETDSSKEFWDGVGPGFYLYHATLEENADAIRQNGLEARNVTRGLDNRDMGAAVFTISAGMVDCIHTALESYGDIIIQIDLNAMKVDGYMPETSGETPIEEAERRGALAHAIQYEGYEPYGDVSSDYMDDTIAIYGDIPAKYLTFVDDKQASNWQHKFSQDMKLFEIAKQLQDADFPPDQAVEIAKRIMEGFQLTRKPPYGGRFSIDGILDRIKNDVFRNSDSDGLVKTATNPMELITKFYGDPAVSSTVEYFIKLHYRDVEKIDPKFWDTAMDTSDLGTFESRVNSFVKDNLHDPLEQNFAKKVSVKPVLVAKYWERLSQADDFAGMTPDQVVQSINTRKLEALQGWLQEMTNLVHQDYISRYMFMNSLVKRFNRYRFAIPDRVNAESLAKTNDMMGRGDGIQFDGNIIPFWDLYDAESISAATSQKVEGSGWHVFAKGSDPSKLANVSQGTGWCFAAETTAEEYLQSGDIHIYFDGKAEIAMHTMSDGQGQYVNAVLARHNLSPGGYSQEIIEYMEKIGAEADESTDGYNGIQKAVEINKRLATGDVQGVIDDILSDTDTYKHLRKEHRYSPTFEIPYVKGVLSDLSGGSEVIQRGWRNFAQDLDDIDSRIVDKYWDQLYPAVESILAKMPDTSYECLVELFSGDNKIAKALGLSPAMASVLKQKFLEDFAARKYHTTGQGKFDQTDYMVSLFESDPDFLQKAADIASETIIGGEPHQPRLGSRLSFLLREISPPIAAHPQVQQASHKVAQEFLLNNPDLGFALGTEISQQWRPGQPENDTPMEVQRKQLKTYLLSNPNELLEYVGKNPDQDLFKIQEPIISWPEIISLFNNVDAWRNMFGRTDQPGSRFGTNPEAYNDDPFWQASLANSDHSALPMALPSQYYGGKSLLDVMPEQVKADPIIRQKTIKHIALTLNNAFSMYNFGTKDKMYLAANELPEAGSNLSASLEMLSRVVNGVKEFTSEPMIYEILQSQMPTQMGQLFIQSMVKHHRLHFGENANSTEDAAAGMIRGGIPSSIVQTQPFLDNLNNARTKVAIGYTKGLKWKRDTHFNQQDVTENTYAYLSQDLQDNQSVQEGSGLGTPMSFDPNLHDRNQKDRRYHSGDPFNPVSIPGFISGSPEQYPHWQTESGESWVKKLWLEELKNEASVPSRFPSYVSIYNRNSDAFLTNIERYWNAIPDNLKADDEIVQAFDLMTVSIFAHKVKSRDRSMGTGAIPIIDRERFDLKDFQEVLPVLLQVQQKLEQLGVNAPNFADTVNNLQDSISATSTDVQRLEDNAVRQLQDENPDMQAGNIPPDYLVPIRDRAHQLGISVDRIKALGLAPSTAPWPRQGPEAPFGIPVEASSEWQHKYASEVCPACGWEMFGDDCANPSCTQPDQGGVADQPQQEDDPRRRLPSDAIHDEVGEDRPQLGDRVFEEYGVWQYPFDKVQNDQMEGYYLDWFNYPGSIHDLNKVQTGDKIADESLNMTPYWEVTRIDEDSGRIYVVPFGANPWLTGVGAGGAKLTDHDFDVHTGKYEDERMDQVLDVINNKQYTRISDVAYILLGTLPVNMGPNGAQGGWYNLNDRGNRGSQRGMDIQDIMMRDSQSLKKLGFDIPVSALDGTMPPDIFKYVIDGGLPYKAEEAELLKLEGEDFSNLDTIRSMILGHQEPGIKNRNWEAMERIYYGDARRPQTKLTPEDKEKMKPFIKEMIESMASMYHPNQQNISETYDPYEYLKERGISFAAYEKWADTVSKFEGAIDTGNRRRVAGAYSDMGMIDDVIRLEETEDHPEPLREILSALHKAKVVGAEILDKNLDKYRQIIARADENSVYGYHARELSNTPVWMVPVGSDVDPNDIFQRINLMGGALLSVKQYLEKKVASSQWAYKFGQSEKAMPVPYVVPNDTMAGPGHWGVDSLMEEETMRGEQDKYPDIHYEGSGVFGTVGNISDDMVVKYTKEKGDAEIALRVHELRECPCAVKVHDVRLIQGTGEIVGNSIWAITMDRAIVFSREEQIKFNHFIDWVLNRFSYNAFKNVLNDVKDGKREVMQTVSEEDYAEGLDFVTCLRGYGLPTGDLHGKNVGRNKDTGQLVLLDLGKGFG